MSTDQREGELKKIAVALCQNPRLKAADIARAAGISKATFYRAYESRDHLWEMMNARAADAAASMTEKFTKAAGEKDAFPAGVYRDTLHQVIGTACENKAFLMLLCYGVVTGNCERHCYDDFRKKVTAFFQKGQQDGVFRVDIPASVMTELFGGIMGALFDGACDGTVAPAHIAEYWEKFFWSGISTV